MLASERSAIIGICRVGTGGLGGRIVVEADQPRSVLIGSNLGDERALADLAGSKDSDSAAVGQRVYNVATEMTVEQALGHGQLVATMLDGLGIDAGRIMNIQHADRDSLATSCS